MNLPGKWACTSRQHPPGTMGPGSCSNTAIAKLATSKGILAASSRHFHSADGGAPAPHMAVSLSEYTGEVRIWETDAGEL